MQLTRMLYGAILPGVQIEACGGLAVLVVDDFVE